jgi:putative DNA primase/helicase
LSLHLSIPKAAEGEVPSPNDLPDLPQAWLTGLLAQRSGGDPTSLLAALPVGEPCTKMLEIRRKALDVCQGSSRHDNVNHRVLAIVRFGEQGHPGAPAVLDEVRTAFVEAVAANRQGGHEEARGEFNRMLLGAAKIVATSPTPESKRGCSCGLVPDNGMSDAHLTDVVTADLLLGRWLWSEPLGWLRWDSQRWQPAPPPLVHNAVREYLKSRYQEARETAARLTVRIEELNAHRGLAKANGSGNGASAAHEIEGLVQRLAEAEQETKQWYATLTKARIVNISELTRGTVACNPSEFDAKPDLLNVENGVVDLSSGELKPHDPKLLLTKLAPVVYRPGAWHADWEKALAAVPEDACGWYQERLGQAITGHIPPDDVLVVQIGTGENGKTTLMGGVQAVLGDYFVLASERVLIADPTAHPTELMDLRGARLALIEETPEERRLSVSRLKKVVGNPTITARRIRHDSMTFPTTHALFVSTNYLPIIEETDHGTWRRLACLRFPYLFRKPGQALRGPDDRSGDPDLRQRLREGREGQHEAILAWLVEGARRWYAAGRRMSLPPARIVDDTRDWQRYSDLFLAYVDEHLVYDLDRHVMSRELLAHFNAWLTERGHRPWSDRTFNKRIEEHHETSARQVVRKVLRLDPERLSRPSSCIETDPPQRYHAWLGVRFRTDGEPFEDREESASGALVQQTKRDESPDQPFQPFHPSPSQQFGSAGPNEGGPRSSHSSRSVNSDEANGTAGTTFLDDREIERPSHAHMGVYGEAVPAVPPRRKADETADGVPPSGGLAAEGQQASTPSAPPLMPESNQPPDDDDPIVEWVL